LLLAECEFATDNVVARTILEAAFILVIGLFVESPRLAARLPE